jgi:hypothetical protein
MIGANRTEKGDSVNIESEPDMQAPAAMPAFTVEIGTDALVGPARNSVGGWPFLAEGQAWPECFCGERMALFFQLDVPQRMGPFSGDHLAVFHCSAHNDAVFPPLTEGRLAAEYWDVPQGPYSGSFARVLLQREAALPAPDPDPLIRALPLKLVPFADELDAYGLGAQGFKVGGVPSWAQDPEYYRCACGVELVYLCQVPENWEFEMYPGSPDQPYSIGDALTLMLGNEVYLLACPAHCNPAAVWPVNQR